jgi:preprotein translocase subunit SecG
MILSSADTREQISPYCVYVCFESIIEQKQIVFLTFWQGLSIAIFVQLHHQKQQDVSTVMGTSTTSSSSSSSSSSKSIHEQAMEIQNVLLCLEMLFFSIAHWCVFPAEEWEPQYHERRLQELEEQQDDDDNDNNNLDPNGNRRSIPSRRRRRRHGGGEHQAWDWAILRPTWAIYCLAEEENDGNSDSLNKTTMMMMMLTPMAPL